MTHCILLTDIELAKKLVTAGRPDSAIVAALAQRGVDSADAAQLVADLRDGRQVTPQIPAGLELGSRRRSRSRRPEQPSGPQQPSRGPETSPRPERAAERHSDAPKKSSTFWLIAVVPICFVVAIIGVLISNHLHRVAEDAPPNKAQPAAPAPAAVAPAGTSQKAPPGGTEQGPVRKPDSGVRQPIAAGTSNAPAPHSH
jgi:hypothetical protein